MKVERVAAGFVALSLVTIAGIGLALRLRRSPPPTPAARQVDLATLPKVVTISKGETVALEPYLEPGKTTFVEFAAEW